MTLLLDTHVFLWWIDDAPELGPAARDAIADPQALVLISAASAWEIAIKVVLGRIRIHSDDVRRAIHESGFTELPVRVEHGLAAGALPPHHRDPFDRMLVAQAQVERLTLVTRDRRIEPYDVKVLWA